MTKNAGSKIVEQIQEIRSRRYGSDYLIIEFEIDSRLRQLRLALESVKKNNASDELLRYFPVAAIACLETHFRNSVAQFINAGGSYLEIGIKLTGDNFGALDILLNIEKQTVTIGDIVAYSLPFSSISHLEDTYGKLLGRKFKSLAKEAIDPYLKRQDKPDAPPIIGDDADEVWRSLVEGFKIRHIIAHETASQFRINHETASNILNAVDRIINAMDAIIWETIRKDEPLTQHELNIDAWKKYKRAKAELATTLRVIRNELDSNDRRNKFIRTHLRWKKYIEETCEFVVSPYHGGSIKPLIRHSYLSDALNSRIKELKDMHEYWEYTHRDS